MYSVLPSIPPHELWKTVNIYQTVRYLLLLNEILLLPNKFRNSKIFLKNEFIQLINLKLWDIHFSFVVIDKCSV